MTAVLPAVPSDAAAASLLAPSASHCANCRAVIPAGSHYCATCGAPRLDERPFTLRRFAHDLWAEVTNLDSHSVRTFRALLTSPGRLTKDYLDGRTRWYLPPLRVYLLTFGLMIFARTFTSTDQTFAAGLKTATAAQQSNPALADVRAKAATAGVAAPDFAQAIGSAMQQSLSNQWLHLVDPLVVGALLVMMYRKRRRNYAEHVLFALHILAFNWLLSIVTTELHSLRGFPSGFDAISVIHWIAFGTYFYIASRRVYGESHVRTGVKSIVFVAGGQLAMFVVPFGVALTTSIWTAIAFASAVARHPH